MTVEPAITCRRNEVCQLFESSRAWPLLENEPVHFLFSAQLILHLDMQCSKDVCVWWSLLIQEISPKRIILWHRVSSCVMQAPPLRVRTRFFYLGFFRRNIRLSR